MSDQQDNKPSEQEVAKANETELAQWQGDFKEEDLVIPYKREDGESADAEKSDDKPKETEQADEPEDAEEVPEIVEYEEPQPIVTAEDPGEYTPADYSFEVTLANGKSVTISTPEEAEKIADDPDNFETPKQLLDFIRKSNKMENNLTRDYDKWKQQKDTYEQQSQEEQTRQEVISNFSNEFDYLVDKGLLPAVPKEYIEADWTDPMVAKQEGVREQVELLNYMVTENNRRAKSGVRPLVSIVDAYNAWAQDNGRKSAEQERKQAAEARKKAGARVAGVSAGQTGSYVPKGIAVGDPNKLRRRASVWD